jgi:AmmeMemoRadiSam system protein B
LRTAEVRRVILLGPAHFVSVRGLAASSAVAFASPLGRVSLDRSAQETILQLPQVHVFDPAHAPEHSLEVHLPFLQTVLADFTLVPLLAGEATPTEVAEVLTRLWGGSETVIVVSSDLSHYHDYNTARQLDAGTAEAIQSFEPLVEGQACGRIPINGLLRVARQKGLRCQCVDLRNSGDTAGPRDQVVGYGAFVLWEPEAQPNEVQAEPSLG